VLYNVRMEILHSAGQETSSRKDAVLLRRWAE
jgi:hypothetical protein